MSFKKYTGTFKSSYEKSSINYYIYEPTKKPFVAVLQISHGMCEYIERYEGLAEYLTDNGIIVCGNDHLGHGNAAKETNTLGYFAKKDGYKLLAADLKKLTVIMKKKYKDLPYFLLGHSMGSFVARRYLAKYGDMLNGCIIMGTSGKNPLMPFALSLAKRSIRNHGEMFRNESLKAKSFAGYNSKWKSESSQNAWLTRDKEIVDKYDNDELCNFTFTSSAYLDLFTLLNSVSSKNWAKAVPNIPILVTSGKDDPVGNYGKGVTQVYRWLKDTGHDNVEIELYDGGRHEILNETNRQEVYKDICSYILKNIKA